MRLIQKLALSLLLVFGAMWCKWAFHFAWTSSTTPFEDDLGECSTVINLSCG